MPIVVPPAHPTRRGGLVFVACGWFGEHPFRPFAQHSTGDPIQGQVAEEGEDMPFGLGQVDEALSGGGPEAGGVVVARVLLEGRHVGVKGAVEVRVLDAVAAFGVAAFPPLPPPVRHFTSHDLTPFLAMRSMIRATTPPDGPGTHGEGSSLHRRSRLASTNGLFTVAC
ncbi:hypothetical protein MF672_007810 [Actinomadura sp. ATCC 31491]|uniref:Uncharacterized protein n=1 Tax=Actinomadura luzonensis TaxID=2805427 RepID=A0ABT0FNW0_9ACTN|nr:hypothetical protein [Actinomadura luzonensis]MCK2213690.1 hypothetical protein [Actinomadura luzonensis]